MGEINVKRIQVNEIEHLCSATLGIAPRARVEFAVKEGLLKFDREWGDYLLTKKSLTYQNFWAWLQGHEASLVPRVFEFK